jgi:hypothetical protein
MIIKMSIGDTEYDLRIKELDDGRFYVTCQNLEGFHYLLDADETSEAIKPSLIEFLNI